MTTSVTRPLLSKNHNQQVAV